MVWWALAFVVTSCGFDSHCGNNQRAFLAPVFEEAKTKGADPHQEGFFWGVGAETEEDYKENHPCVGGASLLEQTILTSAYTSSDNVVVLQNMSIEQSQSSGEMQNLQSALVNGLDRAKAETFSQPECQTSQAVQRYAKDHQPRIYHRWKGYFSGPGPLGPEYTSDKDSSASQTTGMPPNPILPDPPRQVAMAEADAELSAKEIKTLEHLRALQSMEVELTGPLQKQLEDLERREKIHGASQEVTHGHLNRLKRLKYQITAAAKRVQSLDTEWKQFVISTSKKIQEHAELYQKSRQELMQKYMEKVAERETLKKEVSAATESMLQVKEEEVDKIDDNDYALQMGQMHSLLAMGNLDQPPVDTADAAEPVVMEVQEIPDSDLDAPANLEEEELVRDVPKTKAKTFVGSTSPNRVANQTLKPKHQPK